MTVNEVERASRYSATRYGEEVSLVQTRACHSFADQLVVGLHEPVSSLVLIEQGTEFRDEAGLPFRHQDLDLSSFLVDLEILDQPKRLAPPLILHQDPERQFDVRLHARPGLIQFSGERIRLRGLESQKILQFLVKPHGLLTLRIILIPLQYDRASLEFHGVFGIPPAAKWDQPATTMMDGVIRFPAERFDHAWPKSAWVPNS